MEVQKVLQSKKLGHMPIGKLLLKMSAPAMLSMLVQSLYNIVDSIFVARLGENALTALSLAFPMQLLLIAVAIGIGIGTSSLISRRLGEGKHEEASQAAQTGLFIALIAGALFFVIGIFISKWFIGLFTNDAQIIDMGFWYLAIVTVFCVGSFVEIFASRTLQAMGNMVLPMIAQLIGAITNIILDPIMIFGLLGFPALGIKGAAIATVIGQCAAMAFSLIMIAVKKFDVQIFFKHFRPQKKYIMEIAKVGLPTFALNAIGSVLSTGLNAILITFSTTAVAVFGVYYKLQSFVFMPCFGLNQGLMPILGYNYGANNKQRFKKAYSLANIVVLCIMAIGTLLFMLIPKQLFQLFSADANMLAIGIPALRIISLCFIPAAFDVIMVAMFAAIGHGMKALWISLLRQIALLLPIAFIFGKYIGLNALWFAFPISDIVTIAIFIPIAVKTVKDIFAAKNIMQPLSLELKTCEVNAIENAENTEYTDNKH